jgi:hypothetical protein
MSGASIPATAIVRTSSRTSGPTITRAPSRALSEGGFDLAITVRDHRRLGAGGSGCREEPALTAPRRTVCSGRKRQHERDRRARAGRGGRP